MGPPLWPAVLLLLPSLKGKKAAGGKKLRFRSLPRSLCPANRHHLLPIIPSCSASLAASLTPRVYRLYKAQDDWFFIAWGHATFWHQLCLALDHPEWVAEPRYKKAPWGIAPADRDELAECLAAIFIGTDPFSLLSWRRPTGRHSTKLCHPCFSATSISWPTGSWPPMPRGRVQQTGIFAKFSRTPATLPCVAPLLGQHAVEVLREIAGYDQEKITGLLEAQAIQQT